MDRFQTQSQHIQTNRFLYQILEQIGQGQEGAVFKAINLTTNEFVAIKKQTRTSRNEEKAIRLLANKQFKNVINILDYFYQGKTLIVVMELGERVLEIEKNNRNEEIIINQFLEIGKGIREIHSEGFIHRDIKPENIIYTKSQNGGITLKICDTGLMRDRIGLKTVNVGTPYYMPPEQIKQSQYDEKVDIWALGLVLYEMFQGWPLFLGTTKEEVYEKITSVTQEEINQAIDRMIMCPQKIKTLLKEMIVISPKNRSPIDYTLNIFLSPLHADEIRKQYEFEQQIRYQKLEEEKQKWIQEYEKKKAQELEQIKQLIMDQQQEEFKIQKLKLEQQMQKEFQEEFKKFFTQNQDTLTKYEGNQGRQDYHKNKLIFRNTLQEQLISEKENKIEAFRQLKTLQVQKLVQEEQQYRYEEEMRKLIVKFNQKEQNHFQALKFSIINQMTACQNQINSYIKYLTQKLTEINIIDEQDIRLAQQQIELNIQGQHNELQLVEHDIEQINKFITLKQLQDIYQKYVNKVNEVHIKQTQQMKIIEDQLKVVSFISFQNKIEKQQQLIELQQQCMIYQNNCQNIEIEVEKLLKICEDKIGVSIYCIKQLKDQLVHLKLRYSNLKGLNFGQTKFQTIKVYNISDQIQLKVQHLSQFENQINQYAEITKLSKILLSEYEKLIKQIVENNENQKILLLLDYDIKIKDFRVTCENANKNYPMKIQQLFNELQLQLLLLDKQIRIVQNLEFENQPEEQINQSSLILFQISFYINELFDQTDSIVRILYEEILNYEEEQQVQKQKKELETELLQELSFSELIQSLKEQSNKLSKALEALKYEKNEVPFNLYQEVHEQIYKIKVEEEYLIDLERNLKQDVSDALNLDELQFLADVYRNQIQQIKNKFEQIKQKLERLEGQIIQVSPTFLNFNREQQELYLLCSKLNELLHQRVNIKKSNLFFQQHLLSSNYKTILPQMVVAQQKQYLESKKNQYLTYQQQAEENLALSIEYKNRTPKIQHRFNILNQSIIKHINDMGEQISCCEKGLSLISYLNYDHLEQEVKQFEQNLDQEKRELFTYQIQLNRIRIILNKQLMENPSQALSELKQKVIKYETQTIKQNYNFSKDWQQIFSQFQTQFWYAVQVKCNAILVKLLELKRFSTRFLNSSQKQTSSTIEVSQIYSFVQEHLIYYHHYLINIQDRKLNKVEELCFLGKYQDVDSKSEIYYSILTNMIKWHNSVKLKKVLKDQDVVKQILKDYLLNLEGNKIKIFKLMKPDEKM